MQILHGHTRFCLTNKLPDNTDATDSKDLVVTSPVDDETEGQGGQVTCAVSHLH